MTFSLAARRTQRQVICATLLCLTVLVIMSTYEVGKPTFLFCMTGMPKKSVKYLYQKIHSNVSSCLGRNYAFSQSVGID